MPRNPPSPERKQVLLEELRRLQKWRVPLVHRDMVHKDLLPWQKSQLRASRDRIDILEEELHGWALDEYEKRMERISETAVRIEALIKECLSDGLSLEEAMETLSMLLEEYRTGKGPTQERFGPQYWEDLQKAAKEVEKWPRHGLGSPHKQK